MSALISFALVLSCRTDPIRGELRQSNPPSNTRAIGPEIGCVIAPARRSLRKNPRVPEPETRPRCRGRARGPDTAPASGHAARPLADTWAKRHGAIAGAVAARRARPGERRRAARGGMLGEPRRAGRRSSRRGQWNPAGAGQVVSSRGGARSAGSVVIVAHRGRASTSRSPPNSKSALPRMSAAAVSEAMRSGSPRAARRAARHLGALQRGPGGNVLDGGATRHQQKGVRGRGGGARSPRASRLTCTTVTPVEARVSPERRARGSRGTAPPSRAAWGQSRRARGSGPVRRVSGPHGASLPRPWRGRGRTGRLIAPSGSRHMHVARNTMAISPAVVNRASGLCASARSKKASRPSGRSGTRLEGGPELLARHVQNDVGEVLAPERALAGQRLVGDDAERPHVGAVIDALGGARLLGAHVLRRAETAPVWVARTRLRRGAPWRRRSRHLGVGPSGGPGQEDSSRLQDRGGRCRGRGRVRRALPMCAAMPPLRGARAAARAQEPAQNPRRPPAP